MARDLATAGGTAGFPAAPVATLAVGRFASDAERGRR